VFEILPQSHGRRVALKASGKLTHDDYQWLTPALEARISEVGPLSVLFDMESFEGWELRAAWDDFLLGLKHLGDFERIALVGDRKWEEIGARIADHLIKAEVRFFDVSERDAAWMWIEANSKGR